jgi:TPR repeat protein
MSVFAILVGLCQNSIAQDFGAAYKSGIAAYQAKDYVKAREYLLPEAEKGNPDAQTKLGEMYQKGYGVPADGVKAVQWYTKAAELNFVPALTALLYVYEFGAKGVPEDQAKTAEWRSKLAAAKKSAGSNSSASASPAASSRWVKYRETSSAIYYYDPKFTKRYGKFAKALTLFDLKESNCSAKISVEKCNAYKTNPKRERSEVAVALLDCQRPGVQNVEWASFNQNMGMGKPLRTDVVNNGNSTNSKVLEEIELNHMIFDEHLLQIVCKQS